MEKREITRFDKTKIAQKEHDVDKDAKRVTIVETDLAIAVSAEDGDSVESVPRALRMAITADQELDTLLYREIAVQAPEGAQISYTIDGQTWHTSPISDAQPIKICAYKVKISTDATILMRS